MLKRTRLLSAVNSWGLIAAGSAGIILSLAGILVDITPYASSVLLLILGLLGSGLGLERVSALEQISSRLDDLITKLTRTTVAAEELPAVRTDIEKLKQFIGNEVHSLSNCRIVFGYQDTFRYTTNWLNDLRSEILTIGTVETGAAPDWWVDLILERMRDARKNGKAITYKVFVVVNSDDEIGEIQKLYLTRRKSYQLMRVDEFIEWKVIQIERHLSFDVTIFDRKHVSIRFLTEPGVPETHASILIEDNTDLAVGLREWYGRRFAEGSKLTNFGQEGANGELGIRTLRSEVAAVDFAEARPLKEAGAQPAGSGD